MMARGAWKTNGGDALRHWQKFYAISLELDYTMLRRTPLQTSISIQRDSPAW